MLTAKFDAAKLAELLDALPPLTKKIAAVKAFAIAYASAGGAIPGYKLVRGRGVREWTDEAKAAKELVKFGIADPYEHKLLSPAKAEKVVARRFVALIKNMVHKTYAADTVVPDTDERQEITTLKGRLALALVAEKARLLLQQGRSKKAREVAKK